MKKLASIKVEPQEQAIRLSDYVAGKFEILPSKKGMKKAIEQGLVKVNGSRAKTATYVSGNEIIELYGSKKVVASSSSLDIKVVYEDDHLAIIDKPAGIVVSGNQKRTIRNALPSILNATLEKTSLSRPEPAHRLDYATSGLLIIAKTHLALTGLHQMFEQRTIEKKYHAVITGKIKIDEETINSEINGKTATTEYKVIQRVASERFGELGLLQLKAITGRRHQLRIHMSEAGHPILGDQKYSPKGKTVKGKGLYLHATSVKLIHPITEKEIKIDLKLPNKFYKIFPAQSDQRSRNSPKSTSNSTVE